MSTYRCCCMCLLGLSYVVETVQRSRGSGNISTFLRQWITTINPIGPTRHIWNPTPSSSSSSSSTKNWQVIRGCQLHQCMHSWHERCGYIAAAAGDLVTDAANQGRPRDDAASSTADPAPRGAVAAGRRGCRFGVTTARARDVAINAAATTTMELCPGCATHRF